MTRSRLRRCVYCAARTHGRACGSHRDLLELDPSELLRRSFTDAQLRRDRQPSTTARVR